MRGVLVDRLAALSFKKAEFYDTIAKRPDSAILAYTDFVRHYPQSAMAETARQRILELEQGQGATHEK